MSCSQARRRLDSVHPRHPHVDEDEIRVDLVGELEGFLAAACLSQRLEAVGRLDHLARDASEDRLIVDGDDADGRLRSVRGWHVARAGSAHASSETFVSPGARPQ